MEVQIKTHEDYVKFLMTFIKLDDPRMWLFKAEMNRLWEKITSVVEKISNRKYEVAEVELGTSNKKEQANRLQQHALNAEPQSLERPQEQVIRNEKLLDERQHTIEHLRSMLIGPVCVQLATLTRINTKQLDQKQKDIDLKMQQIGQLRSLHTATQKRLAVVENEAAIAANHLATVREQLATAEGENIQLQTTAKDLQRDFDKEKLQIIEKQTTQLEELHAQAYHDVHTKSFEHANAMKKVDDLKREMRILEKENQSLCLTKTVTEKECEDLKATVENLKGYGEGYTQIKRQLEELQTAYNDAIFERDEIQERLNAMTTVEKSEVKHEPKSNSPKSTSAAPR